MPIFNLLIDFDFLLQSVIDVREELFHQGLSGEVRSASSWWSGHRDPPRCYKERSTRWMIDIVSMFWAMVGQEKGKGRPFDVCQNYDFNLLDVWIGKERLRLMFWIITADIGSLVWTRLNVAVLSIAYLLKIVMSNISKFLTDLLVQAFVLWHPLFLLNALMLRYSQVLWCWACPNP